MKQNFRPENNLFALCKYTFLGKPKGTNSLLGKVLWLFILFWGFSCTTTENESAEERKSSTTTPDSINITTHSAIPKPQNKEKPQASFNTDTTRSGTCLYDSSMRSQGLINVQELDPSIMVQLKYSSTDNFVGKDVYGCLNTCYLQKKAAHMLARASEYLQKEHSGLRLLVYDGARPHSIQKILWASLPQYSPGIRKNYVADPAEGSIHNYGSAVDLTLADSLGKPLDMGTKYDFFGELAYPKAEQRLLAEGKLNKQQINNRLILRQAMRQAGFMPIEYEWWHFNALSRAAAKQQYNIVN